MEMLGINNAKAKIIVYGADQVTKIREMKKTLLELVEWFNRFEKRGAHITPNGVNGAIVMTDKRYFVVTIEC